jgi:imidazolonepropionase-like amidohydrolase
MNLHSFIDFNIMSNDQKILLKDGLVLTYKNKEPGPHAFQADVLIENGRIKAVEPNIQASGPGIEVFDCSGKWITPGQIDTHRYKIIAKCPRI